MCFWQWLISYKEIIAMFANLATVIAITFVARALFLNAKAVKLQRQGNAVNLFHNLSTEINSLFDKELDYYDEKGHEKKTYENWLDRLLGAFEYYAFYANRDYLSKEMAEFFMLSIVHYCKKATEYPGLIKEIEEMSDQEAYCEIKNYYQKYVKEECPF